MLRGSGRGAPAEQGLAPCREAAPRGSGCRRERERGLSPFLVAVAVDKNDSGINDEDNNKGDDNNSINITNADNHC